MGIKVTGVGQYVPELVVTNDDLAQIVDTSDEWISKRTGIKRRRIANGELAYQIGAKAARQAIEDANLTIDEIDMIIATTITPDCMTPSVACLIGCELGAKNAVAFDVNGACTGYVYAFDMARNFLELGSYRNIVIVSTEILSRAVNFEDRSTCVLFGDGAGATVVTKSNGIYASYLGGKPTQAFDLFSKIEYRKNPWNTVMEEYGNEKVDLYPSGYMYMDGEEIFKFAATMLPKVVKTTVERANMSLDDLDMLIPHQANVRILEVANKKLKLSEEKLYIGIEDYGNISSACIPVGMCHLKKNHKLKNKDIVCIAGFGAGLTYGAAIFEWES